MTESASDLMLDITDLSLTEQALDVQADLSQILTGADIIPRRSPGSIAPLSFGQQQIWLLDQLLPDPSVYNECVSIHLPGLLDVTALERSFNEIIRRHEAWRTSFPLVGEQPAQLVHAPSILTLPLVDLRHLPGAEREEEALRRAAYDVRIPFKLAQGPLLRATLVRLDDAEYRLFLTVHSIIADRMSLSQVFLPELYLLYEAFASDQPSSLPDLSIQYADFAVWQRERLQGDVFAEHLAYWKQQLAGAPPVLDLPGDRPRPPAQSYRGSTQTFAFPKQLGEALKTLSRQENVTLYMTLTAAFQALLQRYTGQEDLLLGTVTSSRKRAEVQNVVGYFLNTVVLRTSLAGNPSFLELLARVRTVFISARQHEDMPFDFIVKELQPERSLSYHPLVQVLLSLQPQLPALPAGWTVYQMAVSTHASKFDLSLELDNRPEGLTGRFTYNTDLFDSSTISRMVGHWRTLLEGIIVDPSQHLAELPLFTEEERQILLEEWNDTATAYPQGQCVHQLFEAQVERTPDAVAAIFADEALTYRQLNTKANQLAHHLRQLGIRAEALVGICVERSLDMLIGLLGILKAGGAYVPLDPAYPSERLGFMLEDAQVGVLVTQRHLLDRLPERTTQVICINAGGDILTGQKKSNPASEVQHENLAYVIYTSGSTGKPKGVMITQQGLSNYVRWSSKYFGGAQGIGSIIHTSFSFDLTITSIYPPLVKGDTVILAPQEQGIEGLVSLIRQYPGSRLLKITPAHLDLLTDYLPAEKLQDVTHALMIGGEALAAERLERWRTSAPRTRLINSYGPSETVVGCVTHEVAGADSHTGVVPIGRPIANIQLYILDEHLSPVPIGVTGELYIGGHGVARGYLNRPDLTAERFIPHPFSATPGARLYKTGDLVRYRADGVVEFLGRKDHQVKMRGFRIELGEIEAVLVQHPSVWQSVVVAREDTPGDKRLVAYVALHEGQTATVDELQSHAMKQLPACMVPSASVVLETLPTTPNGKVDRRALPAHDTRKRTREETFVTPTLPVHHQLVQIWEELLNVQPLGIEDNFFDLGGHSLLAARLVGRIEQVCGKRIPVSTLFAGATIKHLADVLQEGGDTGVRGDANLRAPLVTLHSDGSRRPFFYLHGDTMGGSFYCMNLASYLGPNQPFYLLEPYKFDGLQVLPSFEGMVAAHIESMRAVQPEGPYLLGGFCNAGLTAYEMARQLYAAGQTVDLLVMVDPVAPTSHNIAHAVIHRFGGLLRVSEEKQVDVFLLIHYLQRLWKHYSQRFNKLGPQRTIEQKGQKPGRKRKSVSFLLQKLKSLIPKGEVINKDWMGAFNWLTGDYKAGGYPGKIALFWTTDEISRNGDWHKRTEANDVAMYIIPGTHRSCRGKDLHSFAEQLKACLDEVQEPVQRSRA